MFRSFRSFVPTCLAIAVAAIATLLPEASAVAPAAPSNLKVEVTRNGGSDLYRVTWTDNALDEAGYQVEVRLGNAGPFFGIADIIQGVKMLPANSSGSIYGLTHFLPPTQIQFRVATYKYNGAKSEFAYSPIYTHVVTGGTEVMQPPSNLTAEMVGDGVVKLKWKDNMIHEIFYQILYRKQGDSTFTHGGYVYFNTVETSLQFGLLPATTYEFQVRATLASPQDGTSFGANERTDPSNTATVAVPALAAPTNLVPTVTGEASVRLTWEDNSTNETGYQIEYHLPDEEFETLDIVAANTTTILVPALPATTMVYRVRAVYEGTTTIESEPSNSVQVLTSFPAPTNLVAATSPRARSVSLTWKDNASVEAGYDVFTRPAGSEEWAFALSLPAGTTSAMVDSRRSEDGLSMEPLEVDQEHEFQVRAFYGSVYSAPTNTAGATARHGFTSRFYNPATVGVAYTETTRYKMTVSTPVTVTEGVNNWDIGGLAELGLSFDKATGIVSGTPSKHGVYELPMTAVFSNGWTAQGKLTLRILRPRGQTTADPTPFVTTIGPNITYGIPLAGAFENPEAERAVRLETTKGNIDILLYPSLAPQAVANFLAYVNGGNYDGVAFHRSIPGFVVQAGGFKPVAAPKSFQSVPSRPSPKNEPGISNVTGTIAAAKLGGNPDSATHDFFLNLANNNSDDPQSLDNQNGGFTAFGRIATPAADRSQPLSVVYPVLAAIAALPRGNYVNNNSGSTYQASLDKRILVDGALANFSDWPMDVAGSAPADMDVSKNVIIRAAYEIPAISHTVTDNSAPDVCAASIVNGHLQVRGLKAGEAIITVTGTDLENTSAERSYAVTVIPSYKPPAITKHPASLAVVAGSKATLTVTATGTALTYQWRKADSEGNFLPISGAEDKSLIITSVQPADIGIYDVVVGNDTTALASNPARLDFRAGPVVGTDPEPRVVEVGNPLELEIEAEGAPAPAIAWLKGTAVVRGQNQQKLYIAAASLADGGIYTARATNPSGKTTSAAANVYVVDKGGAVTTVKPGGKAVLKAAVTGPVTGYRWFKDGAEIHDEPPRIVGTKSPVLTIANTKADFTDGGTYVCKAVTVESGAGFGTLETGPHKLAVVVKPGIDDYVAAASVVGASYDYTVPYGAALTNTPSKFTLSGLPPGLSYDKATGRITGAPTKAGRYLVKTIIANAAGSSSPATGTFDVYPLSRLAVGTFTAAIDPGDVNGNKGGRFDLTTLDTGSYTGKLYLGAETLPVAGKLSYLPGALAPQAQVVVNRKGKSPVLLVFGMNEGDGEMTGYVTDGASVSSLKGHRQFFNASWFPLNLPNRYNVVMNLTDAEQIGDDAIPQGSGYGTIVLTPGGFANMVLYLGDGTKVTASSIVGPYLDMVLFQMLYKNTGSVCGRPGLWWVNQTAEPATAIRVDGALKWIKDEQSSARERSYKPGFEQVQLAMIGRNYIQPTEPRIMSLLALEQNAQLAFTYGGLGEASRDPNLLLTVETGNKLSLPAANPANVKLSFQSASGLYGGSFELLDGAVKRLVKFQGLLVPTIPTSAAIAATATSEAVPLVPGVASQAPGYFLLPQLPSAGPPPTTAANSPILSGKVEFKPRSIVIEPMVVVPEETTVNPGVSYSFSVTATGQGTLSYQWRRNGVNISGATDPTYEIATVAEGHQGTYDVVVSNGATTAVSTSAVLDVNDPVTNIVVNRSPSSSVIATGQSMTFTATALGTGPFTYQWYKGGAPLQDEIGESYTITSANSTSHNGVYTVKVFNVVTTGGLLSSGVSLTVLDGVSNVVASKSPLGVVGPGDTVTFQVTADGSGTLYYQWRKDGSDISGATGSSYTISPVEFEDAGSYDVVVRNEADPVGKLSNEVELAVTEEVSNVVASRSPAAAVVAAGEEVTFSVTASGMTPFTYQWRKNGNEIEGATSSTYVIAAVMEEELPTYDCIVYNDLTPDGVVSNPVPLAVAEPVSEVQISVSPTANVTPGSQVVFSVTASGTDPLFYQWRRGGIDIPNADEATYTISSAEEAHNGDYDVKVWNSVSVETSSSITLSVTP